MRYADVFCTYLEATNPHRYIYTGPCQVTKVPYTVEIPSEELYAYRQGAMAQDAFKSLPADEREFLISGTTPAAWFQLFPPERNTMLILQGPPGSGKSAFARKAATKTINAVIVSTDDWHYNDQGVYEFQPANIGRYHQATQQKARVLLALGCSVIVDNTNILNKHIKPYVQMALEYEAEVKFIRLDGNFANSHGVPADRVAWMRDVMEELSIEQALKAT